MKHEATDYEREVLTHKVWWSPIFDGFCNWMNIAVLKKGFTLDQIIAKGTQEWLDRRADDMFDPHLTTDEWAEFATYHYNVYKERGIY